MNKKQYRRNCYGNISGEELDTLIGHANNYYKKFETKWTLVYIKDLKILQKDMSKYVK